MSKAGPGDDGVRLVAVVASTRDAKFRVDETSLVPGITVSADGSVVVSIPLDVDDRGYQLYRGTRVAALVAARFLGASPTDEVTAIDGNPLDTRLTNLRVEST